MMKVLKTAFILLVATCWSTAAMAQSNAIDLFFSQYVEDENFTVVYISPKLFQMIGELDVEGMDDEEGKAIMEIAKDLRGLRILTTDVKPMEYYEEAKQKINTEDYEVLMTVRDKDGDNVEFFVKDTAGGDGSVFDELFLLVGGEDDFVLLSFVGQIDIEKISKLADGIKDENEDEDQY
jgi:hypothetical protein